MNPSPVKTRLALAALVLALCGPFLNKPFHIDDTFVLHIAGLVLENPLDPFAGEFDWFGVNMPVWEATTNPPLVSYYLAPFAAASDYSETVLHAAMMLFPLLMALGTHSLARRFAPDSVWPVVLFVMTSAATVVSGNVMRDVPAAGLATAGLALFVSGVDRGGAARLLGGALLAGLAIVTKYSAVIALPVMALYPLFQRKYASALWVLPAMAPLALWCLHNVWMYGQAHIVYLTLHRRSEAGIGWPDKLSGALVILGCICYLFPALLWKCARGRDWPLLAGAIAAAAAGGWFVQHHFNGGADWEYLFWSTGGVLLLWIVLADSARRGWRWLLDRADGERADALFLAAWLCAPVLFSIILVPFQAVRHLILALPPLTLLGARYLRTGSGVAGARRIAAVSLIVQAAVAMLVHAADYEFANTYRRYFRETDVFETGGGKVWYAGHWGWQFYAERAGAEQIHGGGAMPATGDIVLRPSVAPVDMNAVFEGNEDIPQRLELVSETRYPGSIPIRVMNWNGASFYACIGAWGTPNMPYRFFSPLSLETIRAHRVGPPAEGGE